MHQDKNKGLADNHEGEFIMNESGTSVSIDPETEFSDGVNAQENENSSAKEPLEKLKKDE